MSARTIVIVPGLWEGPGVFDKLVAELGAFVDDKIVVASLKSTGTKSPNNPTMQDDINGVQETLKPLSAAGERIVIIAHSAGAFIAAAAAQAVEASIDKFVFVAGGLLPAGQEHPEVMPFFDIQGDKMYCKDTRTTLFSDVSDEVYSEYIGKCTYQPATGWAGIVPYAAWTIVPSVYILLENDAVLPPALQENMAHGAKSELVRLPLGHMAMLSNPKLLASTISKHI